MAFIPPHGAHAGDQLETVEQVRSGVVDGEDDDVVLSHSPHPSVPDNAVLETQKAPVEMGCSKPPIEIAWSPPDGRWMGQGLTKRDRTDGQAEG
jgi:hypothetical protein